MAKTPTSEMIAKSQAPVCPIPSVLKDFLQVRSSAFFSSPLHNWVLFPLLTRNDPYAPARVGQIKAVSKSRVLFNAFISGRKIVSNQN